jgi:3-dehydroquinate synthase
LVSTLGRDLNAAAFAAADRATATSERLEWNESPNAFQLRVVRDERYDILVEKGVTGDVGRVLVPIIRAIESKSIVIIIDDRVAKHLMDVLGESMHRHGIPFEVLTVSPGERSKSRRAASRLLDNLRQLGAQRRTLLLAVGGGVICDLVGLVASLYMRGLPYVNLPTTLMAQVDGAIGGKVAVNHPEAKNLLGAFYHPVRVLVDADLLGSLPRREVSNGLAEVVKVAVLADPRLFGLVEGLDLTDVERLDRDGVDTMAEVVRRSIAAKLALLAHDPFERDLRRVLNFGHSIGHALESSTGYRTYRHGEAVSVGLAVATEISTQEKICDQDTRDRIIDTLRRLALPTVVPDVLTASVWHHVEIIKRIRNGSLNFVVPAEIGVAQILDSVSQSAYLSALKTLTKEKSACA